jgi:acetoacetate decarboxylase
MGSAGRPSASATNWFRRVDGSPEICQLVAYNLIDIVVKGSWIGPGRLHLVPHVNAPVADLPVKKLTIAHHFVADLTLPMAA